MTLEDSSSSRIGLHEYLGLLFLLVTVLGFSPMFSRSIVEGVRLLLHWQVSLAVIAYLIAQFGFLLYIKYAAKGTDAEGCAAFVLYAVGGSMLHGIAMTVIVALLTPILIGDGQILLTSDISGHVGPLLISGLLAIAAAFVVSVVPGFGLAPAYSPGIQACIAGLVTLRLQLKTALHLGAGDAALAVKYPGVLPTLGYVLFATAFVYVVYAVLRRWWRNPYTLTAMVGRCLGLVGGVLSVFSYCRYVSLTIVP